MFTLALLVLLMLVTSFPTLAQPEACSALVQQALDITDNVCGAIERNRACYGNVQIEVAPVETAGDFEFATPGDQVALTEINALRLSSMVTPDEWGLALLKVHANAAGTLPGQSITMLMFGDVAIENQGLVQSPTVEVVLSGGANLRGWPGHWFCNPGRSAIRRDGPGRRSQSGRRLAQA